MDQEQEVKDSISEQTQHEWQPDFEQLQKILKEALENIDEEKLHTKHIFDRFDFDALVTTIVRKGSYLALIIGQVYVFKLFQMNFNKRNKKRDIHEKAGFDLFYRIWYCVIISQITFAGIIVEIIWSYQQSNNFFFWLQIYSGYSIYTCLTAIVHNKYEKYLPVAILVISIVLSRFLHMGVVMIMNGGNFFEGLASLYSKFNKEMNEASPDYWIGP